jgi:hypothetical protein
MLSEKSQVPWIIFANRIVRMRTPLSHAAV